MQQQPKAGWPYAGSNPRTGPRPACASSKTAGRAFIDEMVHSLVPSWKLCPAVLTDLSIQECGLRVLVRMYGDKLNMDAEVPDCKASTLP